MHPHFTIFITTTLVKESRKHFSPVLFAKLSWLLYFSFLWFSFVYLLGRQNKFSRHVKHTWFCHTSAENTSLAVNCFSVLSLTFKALLCLPQPELAATSYPSSPIIWTIICSLRTLCFLLVFLHFLPLPPISVHSGCYNKLHKPGDL